MRYSLIIAVVVSTLFFQCGQSDRQQVYTGVVEGRVVEVPALTGGKILQMFVEEGDSVTAGDTLAVLDTLEIHLRMKNLQSALEGIRIQEKIANQKLTLARTDYEYVETRFKRIRQLFEENSVPQQTFDDMKNQYQKAGFALETAEQNLQAVKSKADQLRAQIELLDKKIRDAVVRAPLSGIIAEKYYEAGEALPPGGVVVELIDLDEVRVKIYVSEKMLPHIQYQQSVTVRADGLEKSFTGKISWISPKAEFTPKTILTPETRTSLVYGIRVSIPNRNHILKHGMPVEVILSENLK